MRERGAQSRRARPAIEPPRPTGLNRTGANAWQVVAIIALIAATAGWTTVAVIALHGPSPAAAIPSESTDPNIVEDPSVPPDVAIHEVPELEALLPREVSDTKA